MDFLLWAEAAYHMWAHDQPSAVAVDTETTGVAYFDTPFCATIAWIMEDGAVQSHYFELNHDPGIEEALSLILNGTHNLVFHNAKFDLQKLALHGLLDPPGMDPFSVHDTEALAHLLDEHRIKKLKVLAKELLGLETDEAEAIKAAKREYKLKASDGFDKLPREVIIPYSLKDAEFTILLYELLYPQVAKSDDLSRLYALEQELTFVLLSMETAGMALDLSYVEPTAKDYNTRALVQELLIRDMVGDEEFNPNSPKQVLEAFEKDGIVLDGTGASVLKEVEHPLAKSIVELRTLKKMHSTYLKPMLVEQQAGIIHPQFRQHGTKTGRMSSGAHEV